LRRPAEFGSDRDPAARGIAREHLIRLLRKGALTRAARGFYGLASAPVTEHHGLALVGKQAPNATVLGEGSQANDCLAGCARRPLFGRRTD
jgi:hypothetical protein